MPNREKVIKGIDICLQRFHCGEDCPYYELECMEQLREDVLTLLKEQEAVRPKYIDGKRNHFIMCGKCNTDLIRGMKYCSFCGQEIKWK